MLDDLDHLAAPDRDGPVLRLEVLDGLELLDETVNRFAAQAAAREQDLAMDDDAASMYVVADRDAIDRILGNIVANALEHAPSPGGHIRLEVALAGPGEPGPDVGVGRTGSHGVVLAVRDDGPGFPAAALPHVFDRFYRADPSRTAPGSGLGLAIVRDLADALGGRVFAENPGDGGARVGVVLPAPPLTTEPPGATGSPGTAS
jgi:signal transduction histidine kinase